MLVEYAKVGTNLDYFTVRDAIFDTISPGMRKKPSNTYGICNPFIPTSGTVLLKKNTKSFGIKIMHITFKQN